MSMVYREPIGPCAVISPFNAPLVLLAKMAILAIAAGNTVVAKPSEETPIIAIEFAKIGFEAGLPAGTLLCTVVPPPHAYSTRLLPFACVGVFNIVNGGGPQVAGPLLDQPEIRCLAFTGSTQVGVILGMQAVKKMKRLQLELGGKNPLIVLNDVGVEGASLSLEKAAEQACLGAFFHSGQICMAR
jgi:aldehyde dehydrogenase (NAD+)